MRWKIGRYYPINANLGVMCEDISIKWVVFKVFFKARKAQTARFWHTIPANDPRASVCGEDWDIDFVIIRLNNDQFHSEQEQWRFLKEHLHAHVEVNLSCDDEKCLSNEINKGFGRLFARRFNIGQFMDNECFVGDRVWEELMKLTLS